mmetsp:Transcript_6035/g.22836  ORF Transcript_6035/g.22836 Transcript_6035/m.22836 type:complete len:199 (-) Transcript_6035:88-684(-)
MWLQRRPPGLAPEREGRIQRVDASALLLGGEQERRDHQPLPRRVHRQRRSSTDVSRRHSVGFICGLHGLGMPAEKRESTNVFHFFGHTHVQECRGGDAKGRCVKFLTGGSGGCCSQRDTPGGFVALSFDAQGSQTDECFAPDSRCTVWTYAASPANTHEKAEICKRTKDDPRCPGYLPADLPVLDSDTTSTSATKSLS